MNNHSFVFLIVSLLIFIKIMIFVFGIYFVYSNYKEF